MDTTTATTYRTMGTTDNVTTCDLCGREELKGTIVLDLVDADGVVHGTVYAGSSCGAQAAGRSAAIITREARDADRAREDAEREAAHRDLYDRQQQWLDAHGLDRNFANIKAWRAANAA